MVPTAQSVVQILCKLRTLKTIMHCSSFSLPDVRHRTRSERLLQESQNHTNRSFIYRPPSAAHSKIIYRDFEMWQALWLQVASIFSAMHSQCGKPCRSSLLRYGGACAFVWLILRVENIPKQYHTVQTIEHLNHWQFIHMLVIQSTTNVASSTNRDDSEAGTDADKIQNQIHVRPFHGTGNCSRKNGVSPD